MSQTRKPTTAFWLVGAFALLWNLFGAVDYTMSQMGNEAYLQAMMDTDPAPIIAWVEAQPWWTHAVWAIGVWFGLAGAVLMLMRKAAAVPAFGLSLAGALASFLVGFTGIGGERPEAMGGSGYSVMMGAIVIIAAIFFAFAKKQKANGVLA